MFIALYMYSRHSEYTRLCRTRSLHTNGVSSILSATLLLKWSKERSDVYPRRSFHQRAMECQCYINTQAQRGLLSRRFRNTQETSLRLSINMSIKAQHQFRKQLRLMNADGSGVVIVFQLRFLSSGFVSQGRCIAWYSKSIPSQ